MTLKTLKTCLSLIAKTSFAAICVTDSQTLFSQYMAYLMNTESTVAPDCNGSVGLPLLDMKQLQIRDKGVLNIKCVFNGRKAPIVILCTSLTIFVALFEVNNFAKADTKDGETYSSKVLVSQYYPRSATRRSPRRYRRTYPSPNPMCNPNAAYSACVRPPG
jgi:hypothetical protein